jgi:hypothetical protein
VCTGPRGDWKFAFPVAGGCSKLSFKQKPFPYDPSTKRPHVNLEILEKNFSAKADKHLLWPLQTQ